MIKKNVIIRGDRSGVFFGVLESMSVDGKLVQLTDCRRLWKWDGSCSISQLAVDGTSNPSGCKFTVYVKSIVITDVIEIIECSKKSIESITSTSEWKL